MRRPDEVTIVAGGWSFRKVEDHSALRGTLVAVNDAAIHLRRPPDVIVSMDRLWAEHRWPQIRDMDADIWLREAAAKNIDHASYPRVHIFKCDNTTCAPSPLAHVLNGSNSGACALNLVYRWFPRRVWLYGFDMGRDEKGRAYWYPPYPWARPSGQTGEGKYRTWAEQLSVLATAFRASGIEIVQVGPSSTLPGIGRVPFKEALT